MSETPAVAKIHAICPHCGKRYALSEAFVGRSAKCQGCLQAFTMTKAAASELIQAGAGAVATHARATEQKTVAAGAAGAGREILCPVCQSAINSGEPVCDCPTCKTAHHKDCWDYNRGCGLYGCKEAPETEKLQDIEIPASFWGQTEKECPSCHNKIQAAAVRCRHCGTEFKDARPTGVGEFQSSQMLKQSLPFHRNMGVILLIAAAIPCLSPFAAIVGLIWYFSSRQKIEALPTLQATIGKIAVGLAIVVTVIMLIIGAIYSAMK